MMLDWWRSQQVCVTGATGMIGRRVVQRLAGGRARRVVGLSRSAGGIDAAGVEQHAGSVLDRDALHRAIDGCSVVIHLAGAKRLDSRQRMKDLEVNTAGTAAVVETCARLGVETLVYASTAYVYKPTGPRPLDETAATGPMSPYAISKLAGERIAAQMADRGGSRVCIARIANVYGADSEEDTVIGRAISQADTGRLALRDLTPVRDFIHVDDVADAILRLCAVCPAGCSLVNVSTGIGTSVAEMAGLVADAAVACGSARPLVVSAAGTASDPIPELVLANAKLCALTNWCPSVELSDGIYRAFAQRHQRHPVH
jgi:UDP-glucose 4-epimerase